MTTAYQETLEHLSGLQWFGIRPGLEVIAHLLSRLGGPHRRYPSVHIAGTNGKGSTAAMIAAILEAAGYRVGLYTSPHLVDFVERIRIAGVSISTERVIELSAEIKKESAGAPRPPTFFEFTTAMALLEFARAEVDLAVVETGLGGRWDATNLVRTAVSVITPIDYDHEHLLGGTLEKIASEKAGIIKPGVPAVSAPQAPEVRRVLEQEREACDAPLWMMPDDFSMGRAEGEQYQGDPGVAQYRGERVLSDLRCGLLGDHQVINAAVAVAAIERLRAQGFRIPDEAVRKGLAEVRWSGRLEVIRDRPRILLDGAHNPAGAQALARFLRKERQRLGRAEGEQYDGAEGEQYRRAEGEQYQGRCVLVIGILGDKNLAGIAAPLAPLVDEVVITQPDYHRAADPFRIREAWPRPVPSSRRRAIRMRIRTPVVEAIREEQERLSPDDLLCITGSLYTVGEAVAWFRGLSASFPVKG